MIGRVLDIAVACAIGVQLMSRLKRRAARVGELLDDERVPLGEPAVERGDAHGIFLVSRRTAAAACVVRKATIAGVAMTRRSVLVAPRPLWSRWPAKTLHCVSGTSSLMHR